MAFAGDRRSRKVPRIRGAFRVFAVAAAVVLGVAPAAAQTKKPAGPASAGSSSAAANKPSQKKKSSRRRSRPRAQTVPTADRIREIQAALTKTSFYSVEPSGKWDSATVEAMRRFQEAKGLKPTGKLSARSLQLLGLGSETTGVAPPAKQVATTSGSNP